MHDDLPQTEDVNQATYGLDAMSTNELVAVLIDENARAIDAGLEAAPLIVKAVERIVARLRSGGTLHYAGAGTSGRLGVLDAAECPPTFGTPPGLVRAHIAGGTAALTRAVEGAEDKADAGADAMREYVTAADAVIGISASGGAPYVIGALRAAHAIGALTVAIANTPNPAIGAHADITIVLKTGAEALAGSTRLKAGTAQKIALNTISTAVMVQLGKVYDNLMVDVVATNAKLRRRALRLVMELSAVDEAAAYELLEASQGNVKVALVMNRHGLKSEAARALLAAHNGFLRGALA